MSKAEEKAWEWASKNKLDPYSMGHAYADGYHQAEKDNELTWEDIDKILDITDIIANDDSMENKLKTMTQEEYCKEVLKRFKDLKKY